MSYAGNASLNEETKNRIKATFGQTMQLASSGRLQEASLGCDFILKMDAQFGPARQLLERLEGASGPVDVSGLDASGGAAPAAPTPAAPAPAAPAPPAPASPAPAAPLSASAPAMEPPPASVSPVGTVGPTAPSSQVAPPADAGAPQAAPVLPPMPPAAGDAPGVSAADDGFGGGELDLLDGPTLSEPAAPAQPPAAAPSPQASPAPPAMSATQPPDPAMGTEPPAMETAPPAAPPAAEPGAAQPAMSEPALSQPSLGEPGLGEPASLGSPSLGGSADTAAAGDDDRVQALLNEGQASFDQGAYQAAIDAWSRIFLIDIDHELASQKIEEARRLKDESERALEERFFNAVDKIEAGDLVTGRALLEEVLAIQPDHVGAQERLQALDAAASAALASDGSEDATVAAGATGAGLAATGAEPVGLSSESGMVGADALEVPGEGAPASPFAQPQPAAPAKTVAKKGGRFSDRRFLLIGAGALLVVLGLVGFLWTNWDSLFPNRTAAPKEVSFNIPDPLVDANRRHVAGDIEGAIDILRNVPESSARYQRAQDQIAEWETELEEAKAAELAAAESERDKEARREALLETARRLYAEGEFFLAAKAFNAAAKIAELDGPTNELFEDAKRQLLPIQQQITLFREGEWERMQAPLWSILEAEPSNRDARGLLVDSYYNLGIKALRGGSPADAVGHLEEADRLRPSDPMVERLLLLANSYSGQQTLDPLYSIFVEELSYRK